MQRRSFLRTLAAAATTTAAGPLLAANAAGPQPRSAAAPRIKLGFDNFSVRALGWKAPALIDYAASLKLDVLLFSDLDVYERLDDAYLRDVKHRADDAGIALYAGGWSICPTSKAFKKNWGTAEEHLRLGLRVAQTLGSPVYRCVLGTMEDRKTEGGIPARIADTVAVLRACRSQARDAGVKVAIENHAGDMHSWELAGLLDAAGRDFVGVNYDSGNAAWTLEDPLDALENLGAATICSNLRDNMIWDDPAGAIVQWTAVGDGLIDWKEFATRWARLCPHVPFIVETISGLQKTFPYKSGEFWRHYDKRPAALARFEALAQRGRPLPAFKAPPGPAGRVATQNFQRAELERSLTHLRARAGAGLKT